MAPVVLIGVPAIVILVLRDFARSRLRRQATRRGFEVKQTTGTMPVLREKETNHG